MRFNHRRKNWYFSEEPKIVWFEARRASSDLCDVQSIWLWLSMISRRSESETNENSAENLNWPARAIKPDAEVYDLNIRKTDCCEVYNNRTSGSLFGLSNLMLIDKDFMR